MQYVFVIYLLISGVGFPICLAKSLRHKRAGDKNNYDRKGGSDNACAD